MQTAFSKSEIYCSVIVPVYEGSKILERNLNILRKTLVATQKSWEGIIVDDGSKDWLETKKIAEMHEFHFLQNPVHSGKGAAVRRGMMAARGAFRLFTDADVPYQPEDLGKFLRYLDDKEFDVVVGDRTLESSDFFDYISPLRHLGSELFSFFAGRFVAGGHSDTQCGLKGFRGEVADSLFHVSRVNGFAFDAEILYIALKRNLEIKKLPVTLRCQNGSSVRVVRDGIIMLRDLGLILWNQARGSYCEKRQEKILGRFPKLRKPLPPPYRAIYESHYLINRKGKTPATWLSQRMEAWLHRQVAQDVVSSVRPLNTLELGAGTLNQLNFEPQRGWYDIVEPFRVLFQDSSNLRRVRNIYEDISEIEGGRFDRITSVAVLEHLQDLPGIVAKSVTLLDPSGTFRAAIPNEGTFLWWLGTQLTGFEFRRRYGLSYRRLMEFEHVNRADEIEAVLREFFDKVTFRVFGISRALAFYRFYECRDPKVSRAQKYLS